MTLRIRLTLIVCLMFLAGLVLGVGFLVSNARSRVQEEVNSAATLTRQLLGVMLQEIDTSSSHDVHRLLDSLRGIDGARHLDLRVDSPEAPLTLPRDDPPSATPSWFAWMVRTEPSEFVLPLEALGLSRIVLTTNPDNEIAEVWVETRTFLVVLGIVLLCLNGLLYVILGRWLAPVADIVGRLDDVEHGKFAGEVSSASLPELKVIVEKLNHLTRVLRASKDENDRLARRALAIQEEERRVLARELHDEFGQAISGIKAIAWLIAQRQDGQDPRSVEGANRIATITGTLGTRVRGMMTRLRPAMLDELGLVAALQVMVDDWNLDHPETFCRFQADPAFEGFDPDQRIHVYRIVQEALTNIARHAGATGVDARLEYDGDYHVRIRDNGVGCDRRTMRRGMGLTGIQERCEALGGELHIDTAPGRGMSLHAVLKGRRDGDD